LRRAAKIDAVQPEFEIAFRGLGCSFHSTARMGHGFLDALIGYGGTGGEGGIWVMAEFKSHPAGTIAGEPNEGQRDWIASARGPVVVIRSLEDVGRVVEMMRARARQGELMREEQPDAERYPLSRGD
jgi:hypothetical protein